MRGVLALIVVPMAMISPPPRTALPAADDFLEHLIGTWTLTGTMGSTDLRQRVVAGHVLGDNFVQMRFTEIRSPGSDDPPYEAMYMLGYDADAREYLMYLFDTFGVHFSRTIGLGKREDNTIVFRFDYPTGAFTNTFTWHPGVDRWDMLLREQTDSGDWKTFARKTLVRSGT